MINFLLLMVVPMLISLVALLCFKGKALQGSDMETHAILLTGDPPTRQFMEEQGLEGVAVIRKADLHKLNEYLSNTLGAWYMKNAKKR